MPRLRRIYRRLFFEKLVALIKIRNSDRRVCCAAFMQLIAFSGIKITAAIAIKGKRPEYIIASRDVGNLCP